MSWLHYLHGIHAPNRCASCFLDCGPLRPWLPTGHRTTCYICLVSGCHESCANCDGPSNTNCTSCNDERYLLMTSHMSSLLKRMCLSSDECWAFSLTADDATKQCFDKDKLTDCNALDKSLVLTLHVSDAENTERCVDECPKGSYKEVRTMFTTRGCWSIRLDRNWC